MNIDVFVIIRKSSGEIAHSRAMYATVSAAKTALRLQCRQWSHNYAVARIGSAPTIVATVDENGKWTEVSE